MMILNSLRRLLSWLSHLQVTLRPEVVATFAELRGHRPERARRVAEADGQPTRLELMEVNSEQTSAGLESLVGCVPVTQ